MSNGCLIAEYQTNAGAKLALEVLESGDITLRNVSVVSKASDPSAEHLQQLSGDVSQERQDQASGGRSTSLGMLIGGTVAAPITAGTMIGPFMVAGPLVGMAVGAAIGSLLGSLDRGGDSGNVAADYEQRVNSGSVLVIVHDADSRTINHAMALLKTTEPISLEKYGEE